MHKSAFSLLEILVVTSILAILSTLVVVNYSASRSRSRDGRRKEDLNALSGALENWRQFNPSYLVSPTVGSNNIAGGGQGRVNFKSSTVLGTNGELYSGTQTIAGILQGKYLGTIARDPKDTDASDTDGSIKYDYVLVRCLKNGAQATSSSDTNYAFWTRLENTPAITEVDTTKNSCGGSAVSIAQFDFGFNANSIDDPFPGPLPNSPISQNNNYYAVSASRIGQ